jgi:tetratricopeptide repeat protein 21B
MVRVAANKTNYILLGDAYHRVHRFEESVECFSSALETDQSDKNCALRLARALMIVHDYDAALGAYTQAIQVSNNDPQAQVEYCRALVKLLRLDEARDTALESMQNIDAETSDWESQSACAELYELLSDIDLKSGDPEQSSAALSDAILLYDRLTATTRVDIPADSLLLLKQKAATLYHRSAEVALERDDRDSALESLERALELDPGRPKLLLAIARIHLAAGHADRCRDVCQQLLRLDEKCEDAALMLADVSTSESLDDLQSAFMNSPTFFKTLVRLIEKCSRVAELRRIPSLFFLCPTMPGLHFCRGIFHIYSGDSQAAIVELNKCKHDSEWGLPARTWIFRVYANPNRKYVWSESTALASPKDLETAQKLLSKFDPGVVDVKQLQAVLCLSKNTTETVTQALAIYEQGDDDDLDIILGRCKCYLRLDRQRDATKNLNGIIHGTPSHSHYAAFVEAFLMMTHISLKENQLDEAEKYVQRAIELDRGCSKAWELKGVLAEKRKDYSVASTAFEQSWNLSAHCDLGIGFKLAVSFMRAGDPVAAIKISRLILAKHPNYPKLKETVFFPCCTSLRP